MRISINRRENLSDWHDKFIWFPMFLTDSDTNRKFWIWLETVRRKLVSVRKVPPRSYWQYRIKWPTHGEWNI